MAIQRDDATAIQPAHTRSKKFQTEQLNPGEVIDERHIIFKT
jgi:hypothetical protein